MIREKIRLYGSRRAKAAGGLGRGRTRFNPGAAERAAAFEGCWRGVCASPGAGPREIAEDDGTANYGLQVLSGLRRCVDLIIGFAPRKLVSS